MAAAATRSGRAPEAVRLLAVSKTMPAERIREACAAGVCEIGENYVQEAEAKFTQLADLSITRHFIGHLQRNKAGKAAALFDVVQTIDSVELAGVLGRRAEALGRTLDVLIQVNAPGEATKAGVAPEAALPLAEAVATVPGLRLAGLMGIGPLGNNEDEIRRCYRTLATLFKQLPPDHRRVLSMGMTGDFEIAIEEGSTMVRVGTGIFGERRSSG